jgi:hypothetical protein
MSFSRRKFLRAGSLLAITAGIPLKSVLARTHEDSKLLDHSRLDKRLFLNREAFAAQLHTKFSFSHPETASATLKLIEVKDLTPAAGQRSAAATGKECFTAVFVGPETTPLTQETYAVSHGSLGKFEMFLVPINRNRQGKYYEAVFNRLH